MIEPIYGSIESGAGVKKYVYKHAHGFSDVIVDQNGLLSDLAVKEFIADHYRDHGTSPDAVTVTIRLATMLGMPYTDAVELSFSESEKLPGEFKPGDVVTQKGCTRPLTVAAVIHDPNCGVMLDVVWLDNNGQLERAKLPVAVFRPAAKS